MKEIMPNLQDLMYLTIVGKSLSLTSASISSGIPIATLSRRISDLEKRLNVKLFFRTSKGILLTEVGKYYLEKSEKIIHDALSLENEIKNIYNKPSGLLRISAPVDFCIYFISPLMKKFSQLYPDIKFHFDLSPVKMKLAEHKIDISIRLGNVNNMSVVARPIGFLERKLYASPSYLASHTVIMHPEDLIKHKCILPSYMKIPEQWILYCDNETVTINVSGTYLTNNIKMILKLAEEDGGIAVLTPEIIRNEISSGSILPVLEKWSFCPLPIYITTETRHVTQSARLFIDYIASELSVKFNAGDKLLRHYR